MNLTCELITRWCNSIMCLPSIYLAGGGGEGGEGGEGRVNDWTVVGGRVLLGK